MLSKLIEALNIFLKYGDIDFPTHCEHDVLMVCVMPADVSEEDIAKLKELGFDTGDCCFESYRYGSA
jgi:hypothetical protein